MTLTRVPDAQKHLDTLGFARESLIEILKTGDFSIIEEAFILETVNRLRDIQNSARLGEE